MLIEPRVLSPFVIGLVLGGAAIMACAQHTPASRPAEETEGTSEAPAPAASEAIATFAGGCFWCMEPPFEKLEGVKAVVSGYTGGKEKNPTYKQVGYGKTGHAEAVRVTYDPTVVSYEKLLEVFWRSIDPTDPGGQFADRGRHYRTAIFVHDDAQRQAALASKQDLEKNGPFDEPIVTEIQPATEFWVAETYHQDYYKKNPAHYQRYRVGSGRAGFLEEHWGEEKTAAKEK